MTRPAILLALVMLSLAACGSSSDDEATARRRCEQLRDHVIDLRFPSTATAAPETNTHGSDGAPPPVFDPAPHRAAMKQALGDRFVDACAKHMTAAQLECALSAGDEAAVSACSGSSAGASSSAPASPTISAEAVSP
jgi:hypothetical protein